jgi:cell division protein FtsN
LTLSAIASVDVAEIDVGGHVYFRVRVGPFTDESDATAALRRVTAAGYRGAKFVR